MKRISLFLTLALWFSSSAAFSQTSKQESIGQIELQATISSDLMKHTPSSLPRDYDCWNFAFSNNGDYLFVLSDTQFAILDTKTAKVIKSFPTVRPKNTYGRSLLLNKNNNLQVAIQVDRKHIVIISDVEKAATSILDIKDKKIYAERSIIPTKDGYTTTGFSEDGREFYATAVLSKKKWVYKTSTGEFSRFISDSESKSFFFGYFYEIKDGDTKGKSLLDQIKKGTGSEYTRGYAIPNTDSYLFDIPTRSSLQHLAVVFNSSGDSVPLPQKDDKVIMDREHQFNFSSDGRYMVINNNGVWEIWAFK